MTLRIRLTLAIAAVCVPLVVGLISWDAWSRHRAAASELIAFTRGLAQQPDWRAGCREAPQTWTGGPAPGPSHPNPPQSRGGPAPPARPHFAPPALDPRPHSVPARFFAIDAQLKAAHPDAPTVTQAPPPGEAIVVSNLTSDRVRVLYHLPDGAGACTAVLAEGTTESWLGGVLPDAPVWALPLLAVIIAVLLAVGPVTRRIRRLTRAAEASAAANYSTGVEIDGDDEVARLARAFDTAARRARDRETALRDFVANTTHDVLTPLTVLQGHLAALRGADAPPEVVRQAMDEAQYLGALLHNLSAAARLDGATPLRRTPTDLGAIVERVVRRQRAIAEGRAVALDHAIPAEPVRIEADEILVERAIDNIVANAIRHNRPDGHVAVVLERVDAGFALTIIDDGPGVPAELLERLTERGMQANPARTRTAEGQGLGLHIAARVAATHDFALSFRPSSHGGLEVRLTG